MPNFFEGNLVATGLRVGVVVSRWNSFITERLLDGALDTLRRHGVDTETLVDVARVPGTFEVPLVAQHMAASGRYDAVICLGCLIRGATPHFDYIAAECSKGIAQAMMATGTPIAFGILTTDTIEQSIERAGTKAGNKGAEAAGAAIEMANLIKALPTPARLASAPAVRALPAHENGSAGETAGSPYAPPSAQNEDAD